MSRPKRVLYVDTMVQLVGGAEISLLHLMQNLNKESYIPFLLTSGRGSFFDGVRSANIPAYTQSFSYFSRRRPWKYWSSIFRILVTCQTNQIDLIHTNCAHSLRYVMWTSKIAGIPYVSHVRDFVRGWFQPGNLFALKHASRVISNSRAVAKACIEAGLENVRTIYNPIDIEKFNNVPAALRSKFRAEIAIQENDPVIGVVGQIQPIKGQYEFIQAGLQLAERIPTAHFVIVGSVNGEVEQGYLEKVKSFINETNHADKFHFVGFRQDIQVVMASIDVLAVPSSNEPFGRVAVEGMAAGCPVVVSDAGGLPEIVSHEVNGLLTPPKDVNALFLALQRLICDRELRAKLTENGRISSQRFSLAQHIEQIQSLYDCVLKKKKK